MVGTHPHHVMDNDTCCLIGQIYKTITKIQFFLSGKGSLVYIMQKKCYKPRFCQLQISANWLLSFVFVRLLSDEKRKYHQSNCRQ